MAGMIIGKKKGRRALAFLLVALLGWIGVLVIACLRPSHEELVWREAERQRVARGAAHTFLP